MALTFSTYDLERPSAAQRTFLPSLDRDLIEAWPLTAVDRIKKLVETGALAISEYTVRHHTEQVLEKLRRSFEKRSRV